MHFPLDNGMAPKFHHCMNSEGLRTFNWPRISLFCLPGLHQGFFQGGGEGGGGVGGLGFGYAENSILHVNHFNDTINGKLCLCENSPRFHQVVGPKSKFPGGGHVPRHALHKDTYLPPQ